MRVNMAERKLSEAGGAAKVAIPAASFRMWQNNTMRALLTIPKLRTTHLEYGSSLPRYPL